MGYYNKTDNFTNKIDNFINRTDNFNITCSPRNHIIRNKWTILNLNTDKKKTINKRWFPRLKIKTKTSIIKSTDSLLSLKN